VNGVRAVLYRDLRIYRRRWLKHLASYSVSPLLFLVAFGWGMGRGVKVDGGGYLAFMVPGLAALSSMSQSYGTATEINIARFYWRIFEEFQSAPIAAWEIALGEILYGMFRGLASASVVFLIAVPFGASVTLSFQLLAVFCLHVFVFASAAVVAAMVVKSHADQGHINTFFIVPMSFLCGTFFPLERLPAWAVAAIKCLPLTHSTAAVRAAARGAAIPLDSVAILLVFAAVFFSLAVWSVGFARE